MEEIKEVWVAAQFINNDGSIEIFEGYEVSNLGRVKSCANDKSRKEKIRKSCIIDKGGHMFVTLRKNNKPYSRTVHRLVLSSFNPSGYFKKAVVDHIDSNPSNNYLSNLRWVTQQENSSTPHFREAQTKAQGKRVKVTFLDDGHYEIFPSAGEVYRTLGVPSATISNYIHNHNGYYKKLNLLFKYV